MSDSPDPLACALSLYREGRVEEALLTCTRALVQQPHQGALALLRGRLLLESGKTAEAAEVLRALVVREPQRWTAAWYLGVTETIRENWAEAEAALTTVLESKPDHAWAWHYGAVCAAQQGGLDKALEWILQAQSADSKEGLHFNQGGWLEIARGRLKQAEQMFTRALACSPGLADAIAGLATVCERMGRVSEARVLLGTIGSESRGTMNFVACAARVALGRKRPEEALDTLLPFLGRARNQHELILGNHLLGKTYEALGRHQEAFEAHSRSNDLKQEDFNLVEHRAFVESVCELSPEEHRATPRAANTGIRPVLILGMPRSGTSLLEQILSRHSQVHPAGELPTLDEIASTLAGSGQWKPDYVERLGAATPMQVERAAQHYRRVLLQNSPVQATHVTDKSPLNFQHLLLADRLLPGARVLYCRRDPVDACLSCFFQNFKSTESYATDLEVLGHFYREHERLMNALRELIEIPVLEVCYEDLVRKPSQKVAEVLLFCGLPFEADCLRPGESTNYQNTASYSQVREPIHQGSVGKSRPYTPWLQPLLHALESPRPPSSDVALKGAA